MAEKMAVGCLTVLRETRGLAEVKWELQNFLDQIHGYDEFFESPNFLLDETSWYLRIETDKLSILESHVWISLGLSRTGVSGAHTVSVISRMETGGSVITDNEIVATFHRNDWSQYLVGKLTLSNLFRDASSDGVLTVFSVVRLVDGRHKVASTQASLPEGLITISQNLEQLFLGGDKSDVKVKAGEREFDAHKLILSSRSPVFKAMFEHKMAESNSGVIEILDLDPDHVQDFLLYLYTGDFQHVTSHNAISLYGAADKYSLDDLKEECRIRLAGEMSVDSVLEVIHLATVHDEIDLLSNGTNFFIENAEEILNSGKWGLFIAQNLAIANDLLLKMVKDFNEKQKNNFK